MSRDTATEHTTPRKADPDIGRAHDPAADRDPQSSRRTSLTGLRRVADALVKGKPAGTAAAKQHEAVEQKSFDGVQAALILGPHRIDDYASDIDTLMSNPGPGGPIGSIAMMRELFGKVDADLRRLIAELATQSPGSWSKHLKPEVLRIGGAVERFRRTWERAQSYATRHGDGFDHKFNSHFLKLLVDELYEKTDLDKTVHHDSKKDGKDTAVLLHNSIEANLAAAEECARAVRTGTSNGAAGTSAQDLLKMIWHLKEVEASLGGDRGGKARREFAGRAGKMARTADALKREIASDPALDSLVKQNDLATTIKNIQKFIQGM